MDLNTKLQLTTVGLLALVAVTTTMSTCASDRLEQQVILNTKALEKLQRSGGSGGTSASGAVATRGAAGTSTGFKAIGWGDKEAEILFVEGAAPDAPKTLAQKPKPQGDTYINRRPSAPGSLSYYTTNEGATSVITRDILEPLILVDPDAPPDVLPALATSWTVSEDKLTYTFKLRKGVQFADGRPFTSADVLFSFEVMRDPQVNADHLRGGFEDVVEVTAPDDHTVVARYSKPYWKGVYNVGHQLRVLNKGWYEERIPYYAEKYEIATFSTKPGEPGFGEVFNKIRVPCPGAGAYYYPEDDYDPSKPIEIVQNPFYYGIQIYPEWWNLRSQKWIYIADEVAAFESFRKGGFDVSVVDFDAWEDEYSTDPTITDIANYYEYDHMGLGSFVVVWNHREPPFDDARVRRAMTHLLNRQWMIDELERGRGQVAVCPSKPTYPNYPSLEPLGYDIEKAKALLAEAGWTDSDGDGVLDRDGQRFEFELKTGITLRFNEQWMAQFEDAAKQVGIRITKRNLEWSTFIEDYYARRFDAITLYFSNADPWIDPFDTYHSSQDVPRGGNAAGWHNEQSDAMLEAMRLEFDDNKRNELFKEWCAVYQQEQPITLLIHGLVGVLQNNRFEGVKVRPTGLRSNTNWVKPENVKYE